jgi:hypothetical protein
MTSDFEDDASVQQLLNELMDDDFGFELLATFLEARAANYPAVRALMDQRERPPGALLNGLQAIKDVELWRLAREMEA